MKKLILFTIAFCLIAGTSFSQITFGPKIGANLSKYSYSFKESDLEPDVKLRLGPSIGGVLDLPITDFLSFQPSLMYSKKGSSYDLDKMNPNHTFDGYMRDRVSYIEVPLNFAGKLELGPGSIQLFVGPYIAFAIAGKSISKYDETKQDGSVTKVDEEYDIKFTNKVSTADQDKDNSWMRPFDYGLDFGLGYQWNAFLFNVGYQMGFANLMPDYEGAEGFDPADFKVKNSSIFFNLAWLFGDE
jgi:hypothetical protein